MKYTNTNLGIPLADFKQKWKENHIAIPQNKGCLHHKTRFSEGLIHLAMVPYYPALNRFDGKNKLAKKIVETLEEKGEYDFSKNHHPPSELETALEEICGKSYCEYIKMIIADGMSNHLMLDRKAFTISGSLNEYNIQWYIKRT